MNAASPGPDEAMLAPLERLARLHGRGRRGCRGDFSPPTGLSIFDNPRALRLHRGAMRRPAGPRTFFAGHQGYAELRHEFGPAQDFQHLGRAGLLLPSHRLDLAPRRARPSTRIGRLGVRPSKR